MNLQISDELVAEMARIIHNETWAGILLEFDKLPEERQRRYRAAILPMLLRLRGPAKEAP